MHAIWPIGRVNEQFTMVLKIKKYTPLFPTTQVACATLLYFGWLGDIMGRFSGQLVLRRFILLGCLFLLSLMRYYPSLVKLSAPTQMEEQFLSVGRAYVEAIVIAAMGFALNWLPFNPIIKYSTFLTSLPAIHLLLAIRFRSDVSGGLDYPDLGRPLNPDE